MHVQTGLEVMALPLGASTLTACCLGFDPAAFNAGMFDRAGIECPPRIARSVRKRQAEYFHGRLAAREAMAALGRPLAAVGSAGNGAPLWPTGMIGSISHNDRLAVAAVATTEGGLRGLGIDIERVIGADQHESMLSLVVNRREHALLLKLDAGRSLPFSSGLTLAFSAKESFYKAVSAVAGRVLEFDAIQLTAIAGDGAGGQIHFQAVAAISDEWFPGRRGQAGYMALPNGDLLTSFAW
ncbi:4'-phosphopantetheinyl transferase [Duganella sp. Root198D2]|uniref:4'-phosphopantetheinyl transferase family protein n=1 Tax=Duganella sp. Root198D2 TaxID=1736489 RepID=UPI00138F8F49|nr:4'-phosphopantetheinyl transferase superfamily protein [Duganella sp. Root198D2]